MHEIVEKIGVPAVLEQAAEECAELNQACLKLSRKLRGENPTPVDMMTLLDQVCEEIADVEVCIEAIKSSGLFNTKYIDKNYKEKSERWKKRLNIN